MNCSICRAEDALYTVFNRDKQVVSRMSRENGIGGQWMCTTCADALAGGNGCLNCKRLIPDKVALHTEEHIVAKTKLAGDPEVEVESRGTMHTWWECPHCGYRTYLEE